MNKISVCIATYNGEKFIIQQLHSILSQLSNTDEIIISDDYSTDNTVQLIGGLNDDRIKILHNDYEKGYTSNFESALNYCNGDYVFLCDQDDIWFNNKIEVCVKLLNKYNLVISDSQIINERNEIIHNSFFNYRKTRYSTVGNIIMFGFLGCSFAFRKEILNKALPFPKNRIYCTHDNWIFLISAIYYNYTIVFKPLFYYRRHKTNASSGGSKSSLNFIDKVSYRLYLLINIIRRMQIFN